MNHEDLKTHERAVRALKKAREARKAARVSEFEGAECWHCACAECLALRTDANEAVRS